MTNQELIDTVLVLISERVDKPLFLFEHILQERDSLELIEESNYYQIAGLLLMLESSGEDTSCDPTLVREKYLTEYDEERKVILKYLLTIIHHEVGSKRDEARNNCIEMLKNTVLTFSREFLNVIHLIILFDTVKPYTYLCSPLATFSSNIMYNEYMKLREQLNV